MRINKHTCRVRCCPMTAWHTCLYTHNAPVLCTHLWCPAPPCVGVATTLVHTPATSQHRPTQGTTNKPVLTSIVPQLCHLVAQAYTFACLPHSEPPWGGVGWGRVGTLVHVLVVSAVPRGMCLPVCTPVSGTTMGQCRYTCSHACFRS